MFFREDFEIIPPGHLAIFVPYDLAEAAGRVQAGQSSHVDRGLGVAASLEDTARPRSQRKDVARPAEVARLA